MKPIHEALQVAEDTVAGVAHPGWADGGVRSDHGFVHVPVQSRVDSLVAGGAAIPGEARGLSVDRDSVNARLFEHSRKITSEIRVGKVAGKR